MTTNSAINRSHLAASADPGARLSALLGPAFAAYREAWAWAESGLRPNHPLHLDVDVTTACNFHCPMCPAGTTGHFFPGFKKGLFLDRNLYRKALAEGSAWGLPSIRLGMTGEPLLVADIDEWVSEARQAGVLDISLITNGRLLTAAVSKRLLKAGLTRLMISVDAASPEIYSEVRPGGHWPTLLNNINEFLRIRREANSITPLLRVSFVEMSVNQTDREAFKTLFEPLADYLSFQRYLNILGETDTEFSPAPFAGGEGYCSEPFTRMALHADGGLFPCCADFGRQRPLGNLADGSLLATWQSEAALSLTAKDAAGREPCRRCLAASISSEKNHWPPKVENTPGDPQIQVLSNNSYLAGDEGQGTER
ncbi:hypothetical protein C4J81_13030 [Deltaproteobacteria bacterium Smac51]|nr:hypothetical protein C4J81_13030 [Deltaproteobacteria bacterium Smac51]